MISLSFTLPSFLFWPLIFISQGYAYRTSDEFSSKLLERLVAVVLLASFYFLFEIIFKGRTIGKFITGTKAVNQDGTEMKPRTILLRSLSRVVPFEPFSGLGNPCRPWHDKWTNTFVIDVKQSALNNPGYQY